MKVTQMPPVHTANLAANSGHTIYGVDVIAEVLTVHANISETYLILCNVSLFVAHFCWYRFW